MGLKYLKLLTLPKNIVLIGYQVSGLKQAVNSSVLNWYTFVTIIPIDNVMNLEKKLVIKYHTFFYFIFFCTNI